MKVHRCRWRDFFTRHNAPLVNPVICAWDTNWMRAIDPAVSGLRAERTALLSFGDSKCRFAVEEASAMVSVAARRAARARTTETTPAPRTSAARGPAPARVHPRSS
jgi:L-2-amino-thiazoline-4-carboxylic acid hydrolase